MFAAQMMWAAPNDVCFAKRCCLRQTGTTPPSPAVTPPLTRGERWERCLGQMKRPERVAAVGEGRRRFVAKDIRRVPQQEAFLGGGMEEKWKYFLWDTQLCALQRQPFTPIFRKNPTFLYILHLLPQSLLGGFCENHKLGIEIVCGFVYNKPMLV